MKRPMEPGDFTPVNAEDEPADEIVAAYVEHAARMGASDLFFCTNEHNLVIFARHLGTIVPLGQMSASQGRRCLSHIKAAAGIDIAERRRPQDGRWIYHREDGTALDLRINAIPTLHGEDFTLRLLDRTMSLRGMDDLGMLREQYNDLLGMLNSPSGLILVTGPTGAGKTTTLYACLNYLNSEQRRINTIEDPIEYAVEGIRQSQVNAQFEVGFPELLRNVLRQSPDVIMIGEIRDTETALTAIRAANSGHLVFSTLHAPVAAGAIQSMLGLGVPPLFLSTCLRGVISQRLVRTLCNNCKLPGDLAEAPMTFEEVKRWIDPSARSIYSGAGCSQCRQSGFNGRAGIFEVLTVNSAIRKLIANSASSQEIEQQAIAEGMLEFRRSGLIKVGTGETSPEEILRVIPAEFLGIEG